MLPQISPARCIHVTAHCTNMTHWSNSLFESCKRDRPPLFRVPNSQTPPSSHHGIVTIAKNLSCTLKSSSLVFQIRPLNIKCSLIPKGKGKRRILLDLEIDWLLIPCNLERLPALARVGRRFHDGVGDVDIFALGWDRCGVGCVAGGVDTIRVALTQDLKELGCDVGEGGEGVDEEEDGVLAVLEAEAEVGFVLFA